MHEVLHVCTKILFLYPTLFYLSYIRIPKEKQKTENDKRLKER